MTQTPIRTKTGIIKPVSASADKRMGITKVGYGDEGRPLGYINSTRCTICSAVDSSGKNIRDLFDSYATDHTNKQCISWLKGKGVSVTNNTVISHLSRHAPYVSDARDKGSKMMQKMIVKIHQEKVETSEAIQRIIDIGDAKVKTGVLPVTERLYIEAIKEQGRRGVKTSIDTEFETMDQEFISKMKKLKDGSST
jgi:hypothetical protein